MEIALLALAGSGSALATGLGAVPVFLLGSRAERLRPVLWGMTVGLMGVASIVGLLLPALDEGRPSEVGAGLVVGVAFLLASRRWLAGHDVHIAGLSGASLRRACSYSACSWCTACRKASRSERPFRRTPRGWLYS